MPLVTRPPCFPNCLLPTRRGLWISLQLAALWAGLVGTAQALSLGSIVFKGYIGAPLRIAIPIDSLPEDGLDASCIRLIRPDKQSLDEIPWLGQAAIHIESSGNRQHLVLRTTHPVRQPVLKIGLEVGCGYNLRRDYTILLDPAPVSESAAIMPARTDLHLIPPTLPAKAHPATQVVTENDSAWQIQTGDSAQNIAARLAPGSRKAQRKMADEILALNRDQLGVDFKRSSRLPTGTQILLPPVPHLNTRASQATHPRSASHSLSKPTNTATRLGVAARPVAKPAIPESTHGVGDHLVVTGGPDIPLRLSRSLGRYDASAIHPQSPEIQEQQLLAALDDKTATQIELKERLRQLSALQKKLQEQTASIETRLHQLSPPPQVASAPHPPANIKVAAPQPPAQSGSWAWWKTLFGLTGGIIILAAGAGAYVLIRRRQAEFVPIDGDTLPLPVGPSEFDAEIEKRAVPLSEADIWPDHEGHAPTPEELAKLPPGGGAAASQFTVTGLGSTSQLHVVEHDIEEHESAIELADIMLSFGRVQGAAQTLADYIRSHPTRAVRPWIKLLEVYQAADMKVEFNALAQQINKHFNVKQIDWEQFNAVREGPETLEHLPHIIAKLQDLWGTRDSQSYLYRLLHDNRNGTRQGFSIAVVDEIMILLGVLEQTVGPFRPGPDVFPASLEVPATRPPPIPPLSVSPDETPRPTLMPAMPELDASEPTVTPTAVKKQEKPVPPPALDFELDLEDFSQTLNLDVEKLHKE